MKSAWNLAAAMGALCAGLLASVPARAEGWFEGLEGIVAVGAGMYPDYIGSGRYEAVPDLEAQIYRGNYMLRFEGGNFELNLVDDDSFHAGPLIGYRPGRGDDGIAAIRRMRHFGDAVTAGGFVEYEHIEEDQRAGERVTLDFAQDITGTKGGLDATLRGEIHRPLDFIDPGFIAAIEVDADWGNAEYMRRFFGVNAADSFASGLPQFTAHSGVPSVGAAFSIDQFLSPEWAVGVRFHYSRLIDDAGDSPVVAIAGSPDQYFAGLAVSYVL